MFLSTGADMSIKDKKNRNFLHLAILNGAKLQHFGNDLFKVISSAISWSQSQLNDGKVPK